MIAGKNKELYYTESIDKQLNYRSDWYKACDR